MKNIVTRFSPSPTGYLHIGSMRTCLFNYLFAKKHDGKFILRIEDTDEKRYVPGSEVYIIESLKWSGIIPDDGFGFGSSETKFKQSERHIDGMYEPYINQLLNSGNAYYSFETDDELKKIRSDNPKFSYGPKTRNKLNNSLTLSSLQIKEKIDSTSYVIRLKTPPGIDIKFNDLIRGIVKIKSDELDDKILWKSNRSPSYHLANVIDDYLMGVTHVIRGSEWITSTPTHLLLYEFLGWKKPEFAHLPLVMGPNGKLSKRDGNTLGFPIFPLSWKDGDETVVGYKESGFLPEAFVNILALIGWNPGGNLEKMSIKEMSDLFTLERVGAGNANFNVKKAEWLNGVYLKEADNNTLAKMLVDLNLMLLDPFTKPDMEYLAKVCGLLKEKVGRLDKFWEMGWYFFITPPAVSLTDAEAALASNFAERISSLSELNHNTVRLAFDEAVLNSTLDARDAGRILRAILTGVKSGPALFDIVVLIGKKESTSRLLARVETTTH